jgi:hypothetical protein
VRGVLKSNHVCMLAFFAAKAGAVGFATKLGMPPGKQSGKYSRHIDSVLGVELKTAREWYTLTIPTHNKYDGTRSRCSLEVLNVHEVLEEEWRHNHGLKTQLHREQDNLRTAYHRHPTQVRSPEPTLPIALYVDGVRYGNRLSVLGFWAVKPSFRSKALSRRVAETLSLPLRLSRVVHTIPNIYVVELVLSSRKCGEVAVGET